MGPRRGTTTRRCASRPGHASLADRHVAGPERGQGGARGRRAPPPGAPASRPRGRRRARRAAARSPRAPRGSPPPARSPPARPRGRGGSCASASARTASAATLSSRPVAATTVRRKRDLLGDRIDEQDPVRRQHRGERAGPGTRRRCRGRGSRSTPRRAQQRDSGEAVQDVEPGDARGIADRRQVDRHGPGEQQADVTVDGVAGDRIQLQAQGLEARRRGRRRTPRAGAGGLQHTSGADLSGDPGHPPCGRAPARPGAAPGVEQFARAGVNAVSRQPVGSGPGLPVAPRGCRSPVRARAVRIADVRRSGPERQDQLSTIRAGSARVVDNPAPPGPVAPSQTVVLAPRTGRPSVRRTTSMTSSTYLSASPRSAALRTHPWT